MRMRFWATIRKPAFSISALTAPVRLRSVASGLMIEKVRSIAMITSLQNAGGELPGLYRRRPATASDPVTRHKRFLSAFPHAKRMPPLRPPLGPAWPEVTRRPHYSNFTKVNPFCNRHGGCVQLGKVRLAGNRTICGSSAIQTVSRGDLTNGAIRAGNLEETTMLRKFSLVALAAASLGV